MSMTKIERVNFLRASLSPEEVHLHSFKGFLCKWDRGRFSNEETPILIEGTPLLGHVTDARLIIEPKEAHSLSMILGALDPKFLERFVRDLPDGLTAQQGVQGDAVLLPGSGERCPGDSVKGPPGHSPLLLVCLRRRHKPGT